MKNNIQISQISLPAEAPITLYENSKDIAFLNPKEYRIVSGVNLSNFLSSNLISGEIEYIETPGSSNLTQDSNVPQLEDIQVIENTTYLNDRGIRRAKLVIKVRNSSGKNLLGVDARKAILSSEGGQS